MLRRSLSRARRGVPHARLLCAASERLRSAASEPVARKVSVNGVDLHCVSNGNGHALLCMPGALGTAETDFGPQLRGLADAFEVVSFDPRGYGQSRPPRREFPVDFYQQDAHDAAELMRSLGHERYSVMGWSDGAISAVHLAASRPEHVENLLIFGGNGYFSQADIDAFEATRDVETNWSKRMKETHRPTYGDDLQPMWDRAVDAWAAIYKERGGDVCRAEAKTIRCRTLVAHGAKDPMCLEEHPHWFAENIPGCTQPPRIFPEGKHNLHLRFADEFNEMVRHFIAPASPTP